MVMEIRQTHQLILVFYPMISRFFYMVMQDFWTINSRKGYLKGWKQAEIHDACQALWSKILHV